MAHHCPVLLLSVLALFFLRSSSEKPPNVVLIIVDDVGYGDLGYLGSPIPTPNIDKLANESIKLENYYVQSLCTPTRAALLSGRYPHRSSLVFPLLPTSSLGLEPTLGPILPELLKARNYSTHLVGKWHVGHSKKAYHPLSRGFDSFYGLLCGFFDHYLHSTLGSHDLHRDWESLVDKDSHEHSTYIFSREAEGLIRNKFAKQQSPFFLYLAFSAAHDPAQAPPEHLENCLHFKNRRRREFCGMVVGLDQAIKNVTRALKETQLLDNTIIIFTSDNGAQPWAGGFNYPYKGEKATMFEGGFKVPAFFRLPTSLKGTATPAAYKGLFHVSDFHPTILSFADSPLLSQSSSSQVPLDSFDQSKALLTNGPSPRTDVLLEIDLFRNCTAYRNGKWKLILGSAGDPTLFGEPTDWLTGEEADYVDRFTELISEALDKVVSWGGPAQLLKIIIMLSNIRIKDFFHNTAYAFPMRRESSWREMTFPSVEWNAARGPRVYLYDLEADPYEKNNLADVNRDVVESLIPKLNSHLLNSPAQVAMDASMDPSITETPTVIQHWLSDSANTATHTGIGYRMYAPHIAVVVTLYFALIVFLSVLLLRACCSNLLSSREQPPQQTRKQTKVKSQ